MSRTAEDAPNEALFEGILEAAPDAVVIVDARGRIRILNSQAEKLFGFLRAELVGQPVERLVPEALRERHVGHRDRYLADPKTRPMGAGLDLRARRKDGTEFPVEISLSPLPMPEGLLVISIIRDVTERAQLLAGEQEARAQVESALRTRDEVLGTVSHDLRTPLASISLFAQLLIDNPDRLAEFATKISASVQESLAMIDELVDVTRLRMGEPFELERQPVDLIQLVETAVAEHRARAPQYVLEVSANASVVSGSWDGRRLKRVFVNLLSNATKYSRPGTRVSVTVSSDNGDGDQSAFVAVRDEGVGIPPDDLSKVFEWYYRASNVTGRRGTGLGLAGARRLVELHGGTISVSSQEGVGSTFTVELPLKPPDGGGR